MKVKNRNDFIRHLTILNGFNRLAPNTLLFQNSRDVITVFVHPNLVIVCADGEQVCSSWQIFQVRGDEDENFWYATLQRVLDRF